MRSPLSRYTRAIGALLALVFISAPTNQILARTAARSAGPSAPVQRTSAPPRTPEEVRETYGKVGMSFEANVGQTDEQVEFLARGAGYSLFLTRTEAVFVLRNSDCETRDETTVNSEDPQSANCNPRSNVLRMMLEGGSSQSTVSGLNELEGKVNYFIGNDAAKWYTNISTFGRVHYADVYEGVDLVYYGNQQELEYDFVVKPGANYAQIALKFEGADEVEVDGATGDLLLKVGEQTMRQHKPFVYQEIDGERRAVESGYEIKGSGQVGFAVGEYDAAEFQQTGYFVDRTYEAAFNHRPLLNDFLRDTQEVGRGIVVGQPGFENLLQQRRTQFLEDFTARAEFAVIYDGLTNAQFVDVLNQNAGGPLSPQERDALVTALNSGTETRASALGAVTNDADFIAAEFNRAFVLMQYFGYLRREPDESGFQFWLNKLNQFGGDFQKAEMVKSFISSTEYRQRFGQP